MRIQYNLYYYSLALELKWKSMCPIGIRFCFYLVSVFVHNTIWNILFKNYILMSVIVKIVK